MNRAAAVLLKAGSEMSFSPAGRLRLAAGTKPLGDLEPDDPWERLQLIQGAREGSGQVYRCETPFSAD